MIYTAIYKRFHLTYQHTIDAPDDATALRLAAADLAEQRRKNHPSIELVQVTPCA